jgi:hypothetical protein
MDSVIRSGDSFQSYDVFKIFIWLNKAFSFYTYSFFRISILGYDTRINMTYDEQFLLNIYELPGIVQLRCPPGLIDSRTSSIPGIICFDPYLKDKDFLEYCESNSCPFLRNPI